MKIRLKKRVMMKICKENRNLAKDIYSPQRLPDVNELHLLFLHHCIIKVMLYV